MLVGAVQRLLDRKHARVFGRGFNEGHHGIVGVEGMVQQHVVAAQFLEQVLRLRGQPQFAGKRTA